MTKEMPHPDFDPHQLYKDNRELLDDDFGVEPLEVEFPYFSYELAREFGARGIFLARADDNEAGTFKARGAFIGAYHIKQQGEDKMRLFSAGNFASGAAVAGRLLEMETNIGVPASAPFEKREGLYRFWNDSRLRVYPVGQTLEDTSAWMNNHPELGTALHPFNDPHVIAGNGTIANDILEKQPDVKHVVVPVGGAGLLSGLLQEFGKLDRDDITIHGVEAQGSNSLSRSLDHGTLASAELPNRRYGGSCVKHVGDRALAICMDARDRLNLFTVDDDTVDELIASYQQSRRDLWREHLPAYEPTTLVAVAGIRQVARRHPGEVIVVVGTGHNAPLPQYI